MGFGFPSSGPGTEKVERTSAGYRFTYRLIYTDDGGDFPTNRRCFAPGRPCPRGGRSTEAVSALQQSAPLELEASLRCTLHLLAHTRPPRIGSDEARELDITELDWNACFVPAEWEDVEAYPEHQQNMRDIVKIYIR